MSGYGTCHLLHASALLTFAVVVSAALAGCGAPGASAPTSPPQSATPASTAAALQSTAPASTATPTNGSASAGAQIFTQAQTSSGPLQFSGGMPQSVGNGACANCHGSHAQGSFGPAITYAILTGKAKASRQPRFVFAHDSQIYAAVTAGTAPDGTQLRPGMPRFKLTAGEFADILAYLKTQ